MQAARTVAISALAFLGVSALIGAVPLILCPDGSSIGMPPSLLEHSPFRSFLVPGILLLTANGLLSLAILWMVLLRRPPFAWLTAAQGLVLAVWLIVQIAMIRTLSWLHALYGLLALLLILAGLSLARAQHDPSAPRG